MHCPGEIPGNPASDRSDLRRRPPGGLYAPAVRRGLRQAAVLRGASVAGSAAGAGVWTAFAGGSYRVAVAVALMAVGALLMLSGGTAFSRAGSMETFAFLGMGPENDEHESGDGLTNVGIFLLVALPLLIAGALLYGTG